MANPYPMWRRAFCPHVNWNETMVKVVTKFMLPVSSGGDVLLEGGLGPRLARPLAIKDG